MLCMAKVACCSDVYKTHKCISVGRTWNFLMLNLWAYEVASGVQKVQARPAGECRKVNSV